MAISWRSRVADESGFGLIELVIAATVLFGAFTSIAYLGTLAMADVGSARLRQSATGLANQALEQVRALPRDAVKLGLANSDLAGDPAITASGGDYRYKGERIPHGDNANIELLVPHRSNQVVDGVTYGIAVYVTYLDDDDTTDAYRVTALASWTGGMESNVVRQVEVQTVVDALGCQSGETHPFAAPCQPFLYATGSGAPGGVTISSAGSGPALAGAAFDRAVLSLPTESGNLQSEQSTSSQARVTTSGVSYRAASTDLDSILGTQTAFASADSDPSQVRPEYDAASTASQVTGSWSVAGSGAVLALTSSAGDVANAKATTRATATNLCPNEALPPVNQTDQQTCATGSTSQGGATTAQLSLTGLGSANLVSLGSGTNGSAHAKRTLAATESPTCPAPNGCVRAAVRRALGFIGVGGLPAGMLGPLGFDYLVRVEGLTTTVSAQAGIGTVAPVVTRSGTIRYWNGTSYVALTATTGASTGLSVPTVSITDVLTDTAVTISASLVTGATDAPACASPCASGVARADSPIVGDITYRVVVAGTTVVDLNLYIDLGTLTASTTYIAI